MNILSKHAAFSERHIGPGKKDTEKMLSVCGFSSIDELTEKTIPASIRLEKDLDIPEAMDEQEFLAMLASCASKNKVYKSYIGSGYYSTLLPEIIKRNVLENPGYYTQYTPYQSEISQGRLEALLDFQTMISELTGMDTANASLLDEATSAAEAMTMLYAVRPKEKKDADTILVSKGCFNQTIDVLLTRAEPLGIKVKISDVIEENLTDDVYAVLIQNPDSAGLIKDHSVILAEAAKRNILTIIAADIMSLVILKSPADWGVDVVVGSTQRFGVPLCFGGPHAAFFATKSEYKRFLPGRIIGVSVDSHNKPALRMALQTREQHIKREKATSNICTSQVLLAIMAAMYAVYHGPEGLKAIAGRIHSLTVLLNYGLKELGYTQLNESFFDTLAVKLASDEEQHRLKVIAEKRLINFRYFDSDKVGISIGEPAKERDITEILEIFAELRNKSLTGKFISNMKDDLTIPVTLLRQNEILLHPVFNKYHSETAMLRYLKTLENKDLSLTQSMIPLGSCTMKLNSTASMAGVTWSSFADIHPFVPADQAEGYLEMISNLETALCEITGFNSVSFQPNSGAQGEYTGLMVIRKFHISRGEGHRNICLIPASAHGTNPASAVMAGSKVVVVKCDDKGNIDIADLKQKAVENKENLSALMVTYPSTHGVFEEGIIEICRIIHENGGQVYMDGANMNAQVGLTSPARIGADVCHLNLHKTFAIPHGGGGPGVGPIAAAEHLSPFMPGHSVVKTGGNDAIHAVSASPYGSAGILMIPYAYIKMLGGIGLKEATQYAILNANYIKAKLEPYFKVLYTGSGNTVAHELIFDMREFKQSANVEVEDIAKRLMDYGFHAPTVSFPVPGTLMVEPTESEPKEELDRFIEAMILIRNEIKEIEEGGNKENNLLKNSPHTAEVLLQAEWNFPYTRERAAFPTEHTRKNKFWPSVSRVNNAAGDRNLVCTCLPIDSYAGN